MKLLLLMMMMALAIGQDQTSSVSTDIDCYCTSHTLKDHLGQDIGRCLTKLGGKYWCYVPSHSTCLDKKQSKRDTDLHWSHKACDLYRARDIDFNVELPSITRDQEYVIDLEHWDIPNRREDPVKTTENLQKAIDWAHQEGYGKVQLPNGHYLVGIESPRGYHGFGRFAGRKTNITVDENNITMEGIKLYSNTEFILGEDVTLEIVANDKPIYCIICIKDATDIIIRSENSGGIIKGDREEHIYTDHLELELGSWGAGIVIYKNFHRIMVKDMILTDLTGDGVYVEPEDGENVKGIGTDVTIMGNNIHNNRRRGISVLGSLRVNISNNEIHHIKDSAFPMGIYIEGKVHLTKDIVINNNHFNANGGEDVLLNNNTDNVFITENVMVQSQEYQYRHGPIVSWHANTYLVIANNNITMYNRSKVDWIPYSSVSTEEEFQKLIFGIVVNSGKQNKVTYIHDNHCQGCGVLMHGANANIQRNKFVGSFLGLDNFTNAIVIDNHVQVPPNQDQCIWSYWITKTTGRARGNTYATHKQPDNIKLYQIPLSDEPWTRDKNSCSKDK